jgi:uncharacterized membrane protein
MESRRKSLLKTISWPFIHFTFVSGIIYFVLKYYTGEAEWEYVGLYGLSYLTLEMTFFYLHERIWARFGKKVK